jgi:hypothetical protein
MLPPCSVARSFDLSTPIACCLACYRLMLATLHPGPRSVQESAPGGFSEHVLQLAAVPLEFGVVDAVAGGAGGVRDAQRCNLREGKPWNAVVGP